MIRNLFLALTVSLTGCVHPALSTPLPDAADPPPLSIACPACHDISWPDRGN
ncbi:MAG: hypothetical protein HC844_09910 [Tabrizicola sp.]|nr:hypothetical protein [Tabrizicola sp.]